MRAFLTFVQKHFYLCILFCVGFLVYAPSLTNQLFWDDEQFIYNNSYVKNFEVIKIFTENTIAGAGEVSNYYRPLTTLSFAIDYQLWGVNPVGYHLTNTLLHIGVAILLFLLLQSLSMRKKAAGAISLFFLLHPIQTEAVVYANSRGDSLYAFFALLGLLLFSKALQNSSFKGSLYNLSVTLTTPHLLVLTVLLFWVSVLSKEIAVGILLLYPCIYLLHKFTKKRVSSGFGLPLMALLGMSTGIYAVLRATVLRFQDTTNFFLGTPYGDSIVVRIATFAKVLLIYLSLLLIPVQLHMERTTAIVLNIFSGYTAAVILLFTIVITLGILELRKKHTVWILFGTFWFLGTLGPVSGIFPINDIMYEHWLYVPSIGFFIVCYGLLDLFFFLRKSGWPEKITLYSTIFIASLYAILTIRQNYLWANPIRFYLYTLTHQETARLRNNLAMAYADTGNIDAAIGNYKKAIELSDVYPQTHYNLARSYLAKNERQLALQELEIVIALEPHFDLAYPLLIQLYILESDRESAEKHFALFSSRYPESDLTQQLRKKLNTLTNQ